LWGPEIFKYFWRLKSWIVGPLSDTWIAVFFIGVRDGERRIKNVETPDFRIRRFF